MSKFWNGLTAGEAERLALLAEECGEAVQAIGKILRHGYDSTHPLDPRGLDNRARLEKEMGDVRAAMILLCYAGDTDKEHVHQCADDKLVRVGAFMHHQKTVLPGLWKERGLESRASLNVDLQRTKGNI